MRMTSRTTGLMTITMNRMEHKALRVIISGGGTGGHIFPAVSIANKLKEQNPKTEILFVGAEGKMEMEKVPAAGYRIVGLPIVGLQRRLNLKNILNDLCVPFKVVASLFKAKRIIKEFKPQIAIGVGGYASAPLLWAATGMHIPALIQEQNGFAGLTNKKLGSRVQCICVAYEGMERFFPAASGSAIFPAFSSSVAILAGSLSSSSAVGIIFSIASASLTTTAASFFTRAIALWV